MNAAQYKETAGCFAYVADGNNRTRVVAYDEEGRQAQAMVPVALTR
ncbi:MAG: hypothetical protein HPY54_04030 [Chthonomonadetes bacterium]|nr:hypothetical protein [Chthonomonadetes bacterium]